MSDTRNVFLILLALPAMACGAAARPSSVPAPGGGVVASAGSSGAYTVQSGDTLAGIAARHGTTVQAMVDANKDTYPSLDTNPGLINVGWVLVIPGGQGDTAVQSGGAPPSVLSASAPAPAPVQFDVAAGEQEIFRLVNEERLKAGLHPLEWDPVLAEVARLRSQDMVDRNYYGHNDPVTGEALARKLLTERGYTSGGAENLANGTPYN